MHAHPHKLPPAPRSPSRPHKSKLSHPAVGRPIQQHATGAVAADADVCPGPQFRRQRQRRQAKVARGHSRWRAGRRQAVIHTERRRRGCGRRQEPRGVVAPTEGRPRLLLHPAAHAGRHGKLRPGDVTAHALGHCEGHHAAVLGYLLAPAPGGAFLVQAARAAAGAQRRQLGPPACKLQGSQRKCSSLAQWPRGTLERC